MKKDIDRKNKRTNRDFLKMQAAQLADIEFLYFNTIEGGEDNSSAAEELTQGNVKVWKIEEVVKMSEKVDTVPKGRYKVEVMVYDETACINLLLWDSAVIPLCGKRNEELGYPPTLDNLIEKRVLFKVNARANNFERDDKVYTVAALCEDNELIDKHYP
ncbi:hypothetical protein PIB30_021548 [Stylosanthes scabra]|uniref:Replication factor A C-terminal domain-containing protein n=1 Tax=Stylosanthes scabra TaxID=79078 RepID=A0ABU6S8R2_9FABA|nr:hypothetical protein [Stylosanthes scabra]